MVFLLTNVDFLLTNVEFIMKTQPDTAVEVERGGGRSSLAVASEGTARWWPFACEVGRNRNRNRGAGYTRGERLGVAAGGVRTAEAAVEEEPQSESEGPAGLRALRGVAACRAAATA